MDPAKLVRLQEDLRQLEQFTNTDSYMAFHGEFRGVLNTAMDSVLGLPPQTIGDFVEREQNQGGARVAKMVVEWFGDRLTALREEIAENTVKHEMISN